MYLYKLWFYDAKFLQIIYLFNLNIAFFYFTFREGKQNSSVELPPRHIVNISSNSILTKSPVRTNFRRNLTKSLNRQETTEMLLPPKGSLHHEKRPSKTFSTPISSLNVLSEEPSNTDGANLSISSIPLLRKFSLENMFTTRIPSAASLKNYGN